MAYTLAYNPSDQPVIVDGSGRTLGGSEWGPVESTSELAHAAIGRNDLVWSEPPDPKFADPRALVAATETQRLSARQAAFTAADKDTLLQTARSADLVSEDETPLKADLVELLTRSDVDLPTAKKSGA